MIRPSREYTSNFASGEDILDEEGDTNLERYRADPRGSELTVDLSLDRESKVWCWLMAPLLSGWAEKRPENSR